MAGRTIDLDAFLAEQQAEAGSIRFKGKDYPLPPEIPWHAIVKAQEMDGQDVRVEQVGEVVSGIVGKDAWDQMIADGLGINSAIHLMSAIIEQVTDGVPEGDPKAAVLERVKDSPLLSPTRLPTSVLPERTSAGGIRLGTAN